MNVLRRIHLYLGCAFAPLLCFFAVSGIWQTYSLNLPNRDTDYNPKVLALLSTLHTGRGLKTETPATLSSPVLKVFVTAMALCLLVTMILGIVMAFRYGRMRVVMCCLAAGILFPILLVLAALAG